MLRSIDFKTMPYLFTDKAGTCLTVEFDGRELDDIYKQVKAMYDQAHSSDDMPTEPGWYVTRDGEDLLSYDGDAWHIHNIDCDAQLFVDGDLETMDWSVVKRTFDADAFPLIPVNLNDISRAERRLTNLINFLHTLIHECETVRDNPSSDKHAKDIDDSSPDMHPQVGDYGVAIRENSHGQEEIPFHIEREEHTGLPVALLNMQLYAKPEDDIDHGQYVSLFQLYLEGFMLSRTGRNAAQNQSEDTK